MRIVCLLLIGLSLHAADWPMAGGDASQSGWQQRERDITPFTVKQIRLIWKQAPGAVLSAPIILGRLITYRGTVELVFVVSAAGDVYAIDGDFGKVFWRRHLDLISQGCSGAEPPAPALSPSNLSPEDEDDDGPQPLRPLYVVTVDGRLHSLNPQDGADLASARDFVPAGSRIANMRLAGGRLSTVTAPCMGKTLTAWSIDTAGGQSLASGPGAPAQREAVSEDSAGRHWVHASVAGRVTAYRQEAGKRVQAWAAKLPGELSVPVLAGGVVFVVSRDRLYAFDAIRGQRLLAGPTEVLGGKMPALAIANGHICFTGGATLICYGLPVEP